MSRVVVAKANVRPIPIDLKPIQKLSSKLAQEIVFELEEELSRSGKSRRKNKAIAAAWIGVRRVNGSYGRIRVRVEFSAKPAGAGRLFVTGGAYKHLAKRVLIVISKRDAMFAASKLGNDRTMPILTTEIVQTLSHELTHASEPAHVMRRRALTGGASRQTLETQGRSAYWRDPIEVHARTQTAVQQAREAAHVLSTRMPFLLENRQAFFDAIVLRTKILRQMHRFYTTEQYHKVLKTIYAVLAEDGYFL